MAKLDDLINNSVLGSNGRYLVGSKKKEDAIRASKQIWDGGLVIVVSYAGTNYVKITDGAHAFAQLSSEGGAITITSNEISDATSIGKAVLTAADAAAARTAIGAGTSNVSIGTTAGTAADATTVVNLTAAQTVNGVKTFGSIPLIPVTVPTLPAQAISKSYFDAQTGNFLTPEQVLPTTPLATNVAGGQVTLSIAPGTNGQALVTEGGVAVWGNQTANSVGAVATNMVGVASGVASLSAGGTVPVGQLSNATTSARGVVLQGTAQADSVASDVAGLVTDFNSLLAKLRTAGVIAT